MSFNMPLELSNIITSFLKPKAGFRIKEGDRFNNGDCIVKINRANLHKSSNEFKIWGQREFKYKNGTTEICAFCQSTYNFPIYIDMFLFTDFIYLSKSNLINDL